MANSVEAIAVRDTQVDMQDGVYTFGAPVKVVAITVGGVRREMQPPIELKNGDRVSFCDSPLLEVRVTQ